MRYLLGMPRAFLIACLLLLVAAFAVAADAERHFYPEGYRQWAVVKVKFIGPESPVWESQGGLRVHFANDIAADSWGRFREGSVIVDERLHTRLADRKVWEDTGVAHVAVMRKDAKYADTGGWYFDLFVNGDTTTGFTREQARARCFLACHEAQAARDYVFSDPRR